ncbi:hypothetical protein GLYMA_15G214400v4 [Glycine max]|uniref:non-specific serine/threonine protein kinase n=1 Tax=Glycine max TaxID=3847 RepID=K7MCU6_SOYBN|nr:G-type lectin S-receptor-like serine/threonine-protein kinase B120 isoform X5 [Glycine max]KAH1148255.1 hypothetical protein GYH30_043077 [Glycine max]KRH13075.1 hypothetical protein GLYMA_15G214400v4 [Glycine max]
MKLMVLKLLAFVFLWLWWSTCIHVKAENDRLKPGNFVLQQLHPNGTNTLLWQSFDYPSTLIPTMKLGVNHKTGHQWVLVSSLTDLVLNPGAFSLEWEPKGQELVIRRRGKVCWQSGKLRNNRFEYIPEEAQRMLKYTIVSNGDEDSFSFNSTNDKLTPRWSFSRSGRLSCNEGYVKADLCYGYNNTGGCQRWQDLPKCRNPGDLFVKKTLFPDYENVTFEMNPAFGYSDCEASCWSNCSCDGFSALWVNETGCTFYHWNSSKNFVDTSVAGVELYMLENTGNITPHNGTKRWIWLSAVIATTLLIIFLSILCLLKKRKYLGQEKKRKEMVMKMPHSTICDGLSSIEDFGNVFKKGHELNVFDYTLVMMATNGFSSENKLGQGGFGPVYKGILPTGQEVAVKRLSKTSTQGIMEFKNELTLICELQHMNLVQLLGCCIHEEEKILIYEYMPNKSLDFYLFDSSRSKLLDWNKRFNIIEGIAQGLLYLHKYSRLKVVHRDLKASVIP